MLLQEAWVRSQVAKELAPGIVFFIDEVGCGGEGRVSGITIASNEDALRKNEEMVGPELKRLGIRRQQTI